MPLRGVQHVHGAATGHPGRRHHAVDSSEPLDGRRHEPLDRRLVGDVGLEELPPGARRDPVGLCHVRAHHLGALLEQPLGRRPPDPRCRTRDDDGLVPESPHCVPPVVKN